LAAEVFDQQPAPLQRFLLATSVVRQVTGPLCDAILQWTHSERILAQLERERLFLIPLDGSHRWYRYHQLFADFLHDRMLQTCPDKMVVWRLRAADWYLQQGAAVEDAAGLALPHLVAARDWERAATLTEAAANRMLWRSGEIATLLHWLQQLPREMVGGR